MDDSLFVALCGHAPWIEHPEKQSEILGNSLPSPFLDRIGRIELAPGVVELVIGPRQAGKSTWIREQLSRQSDPVLVLHAEEPRIRELCRSPAEALAALSGYLREETILVLEEVQHLEDAALFLKGLIDLAPRRRLIATGSSSFQLTSRTRESLAGRARRTLLLPFSLVEIACALPADRLPALRERELAAAWERLVLQGGYPRPWFSGDPEREVRRLVEAFVLRDASDLHVIESPAAFRRLMELAASDIGNLVNLSSLATACGVARNTVARYLELAEAAHVLRLVAPFAGGRRAELTATPKVFFLDGGLRNALFGGFGALAGRADRGALWENAVFAELQKRAGLLDRIHYWRSRAQGEVDFVLQRDGRLVGVEVKAAALARPGLSRGNRSFLAAYRPSVFGVVNASLRATEQIEGVRVEFLRPWEIGTLLEGS